MPWIKITINDGRLEVMNKFHTKELKTPENVLVEALKWLTDGTPYTFIKRSVVLSVADELEDYFKKYQKKPSITTADHLFAIVGKSFKRLRGKSR